MKPPIEDQIRDLFAIVDQRQGPVNIDAIQRRVEAPTLHFTTTDDTPMEAAMLEPERDNSPKRAGALITVSVAAVVLMAGLVFVVSNTDDQPVTSDSPSTTEAARPESPAAEPLPLQGSLLDGRYETDLLGAPMTLSIEGFRASRQRPGELVLAPENWDNSRADFTRRSALFIRLAGWNSRDQADDFPQDEPGDIGPYDIEEWIADNDVIVDRRPAKLVANRATSVYDVRVDPASDLGVGCLEGERPCFWYYSVSVENNDAELLQTGQLDGTALRRFWLITTEDENPILIVANAGPGNEAWLDEFEATTIATLEFGSNGVPLFED